MLRLLSFRLLSFNLNNNNRQEGEEIFFSLKEKLFSMTLNTDFKVENVIIFPPKNS